ncbi:hypothetical protein [Weizmannia acidilactici]|uniref:hypothetical protein n=1 Tax=Weizmannia acidilactici TaxID=2607726 RepID=UPI00124EDCB0|nr:hypothetical protein [Weizmannia acidilactici]
MSQRITKGVFDLEGLEKRTVKLYAFLDEAAHKYGFDRSCCIAIGYSNGAKMFFYYGKKTFKGAIFHHLMVPRLCHPMCTSAACRSPGECVQYILDVFF